MWSIQLGVKELTLLQHTWPGVDYSNQLVSRRVVSDGTRVYDITQSDLSPTRCL